MKKFFLYILFTCSILTAHAQYYLRGEVKDDKDQPLQNVKIFMYSNHLLYYSGTTGGFGITTPVLYDSLAFSLDGYETKIVKVKTDEFQEITLKSISSNTNGNNQKLISITKNLDQSSSFHWYEGDESYFSLIENEVVDADKYPNTSFALNIDKASYSNIRRFLNMRSDVPPDAVRIEELLNYFDLHYKEPDSNSLFKIESQLTDCPWNGKNKLLYLNIDAHKINLDKVPPCNLVFLIDASGSMDMPNKLPLLKAAFQMLVKNLRPVDTVSIVIFGGTVSLWLPPTSGSEKQKIIESIEEIDADGDTPGEAAIQMAYQVAEKMFIKNGNNRVILATDGDFNVGETKEDALENLIEKERQSGVYLTCLGVGMGNYKDSKLEALAKKGNGNYAYLDDIREAEKVLVKEMTQTVFAVADNVFLNVQFNPDIIKEYRLIGFDNQKDAVSDSSGELEGGEIGSGNSLMAIFEVTPTSAKIISDTLSKEAVAQVSLRYDVCNTVTDKEIKYNCLDNYATFKSIDKDLQFGAALVMFGMKLRQSKFIGNADWNDIENIATSSHDPTNYLQSQFLQLVGIAKKMYGNKKRKKDSD